MTQLAVAELLGATGRELGPGSWHEVTQAEIDAFASATGDDQWIHVDPARAADGPFGGTVAHGYLLLSLLPLLLREVLEYSDRRLAVNYGVDRIRFTTAVRAGARVRLHATIAEASERSGGVLVRFGVELEVEGVEKPALVGDVLSLVFPS